MATTNKYNALYGQTILDVSLQKFGSIESLFDLIADNGLNLNSNLQAGQMMTVNTTSKGDEKIKNFVNLNAIKYINGAIETMPPLYGGDYNGDYNNDYY